MSPAAHLPQDPRGRRELGRQIAVDSLIHAALTSAAEEASPRTMRRYRRPAAGWSWRGRLAVAAAGLVAVAAAGLVIVRLSADRAGLRVESGEVAESGTAASRLAVGREYRAGERGAQLAVAGGGRLELAGGTSFRPTAGGLNLAGGEVIGRDLAKVELRAGPIRAEAAGASLALMRAAEPGTDEAAVVVMAGRVRADGGAGAVHLAAGQVLASGWGIEPRPFAVSDMKAALAAKRAALAPPGEALKYRGIVGEYTERLADFRRQAGTLAADSPQAAELRDRITSLTDAKAAHERRLPALEADAAQGARIDRRLGFLDKALRAKTSDSSTSALYPEHPESGVFLSSGTPWSGGRVRLTVFSRR